jgi:hypothetical protein
VLRGKRRAAYSWNGFYAGVNFGGAFDTEDVTPDFSAVKDAANIEAGPVAHQSADFDEVTTAVKAKHSNVFVMTITG